MLRSKAEKLGREDLDQEVSKQEMLAKERDHFCAVTMDKWRAAGGLDVTSIKDVFSGYYVYEHVRRSMYFVFPDGKLMTCNHAQPAGIEMCGADSTRTTTLTGKLYDTKEPVIKIVAYAFCQSTRRNATDSIKVRFTEPQGGPESPLKERASNVFFWHKPSCEHCGQDLPKEPGPQTFERVEYGGEQSFVDMFAEAFHKHNNSGAPNPHELPKPLNEGIVPKDPGLLLALDKLADSYKITPPSDRVRGPSYRTPPLNEGIVPTEDDPGLSLEEVTEHLKTVIARNKRDGVALEKQLIRQTLNAAEDSSLRDLYRVSMRCSRLATKHPRLQDVIADVGAYLYTPGEGRENSPNAPRLKELLNKWTPFL